MKTKEEIREIIWKDIDKAQCSPFENLARQVYMVSVFRWLNLITNDEWWAAMECLDLSLTDVDWRPDVMQALKDDVFGFSATHKELQTP